MKKIDSKQTQMLEGKRSLLIEFALKNLGRTIQQERKARRLTQLQLAQLSGTSINFVSQLESGKPTARIEKILAVLGALGLELSLGRGRSVIRGLEA